MSREKLDKNMHLNNRELFKCGCLSAVRVLHVINKLYFYYSPNTRKVKENRAFCPFSNGFIRILKLREKCNGTKKE